MVYKPGQNPYSRLVTSPWEQPDRDPMLAQRWPIVYPVLHPANMRRRPNVCLMLSRRRRRWANVKQTLDKRHLPSRISYFLSLISYSFVYI